MVLIEQRINIEPRFIGNIATYIIKQLEEKLKGKCTQEYGYINYIDTSTIRLKSPPLISKTNGFIECNVLVDVITRKPVVGSKIDVKVYQLFENQISAKAAGIMAIIPKKNGLIFDSDNNEMIHKKSRMKIRVGTVIKISVKMVRFSMESFQVIGELCM